MARPPHIRRKPVNPFNRAALGIYKGPVRAVAPPKVTPYRVTLLKATLAGEIKAGQGQYTGAWRWHHTGVSVTVTKWVREFIACGWAQVKGAHLELTESVEDGAGQRTGRIVMPDRQAALPDTGGGGQGDVGWRPRQAFL